MRQSGDMDGIGTADGVRGMTGLLVLGMLVIKVNGGITIAIDTTDTPGHGASPDS